MQAVFAVDIPRTTATQSIDFEELEIDELLMWRNSSGADAENISRIDALLMTRMEMVRSESGLEVQIPKLLELYLKMRQVPASQIVLRRLVFRTKEYVKNLNDAEKGFWFLEMLPRVHEAPEYRLFLRRLIGEKFFQGQEEE